MDDESNTEGVMLARIRAFAESPGWNLYMRPHIERRIEDLKKLLTQDITEQETMRLRSEFRVLNDLLGMPVRDIGSLEAAARNMRQPGAGSMG